MTVNVPFLLPFLFVCLKTKMASFAVSFLYEFMTLMSKCWRQFSVFFCRLLVGEWEQVSGRKLVGKCAVGAIRQIANLDSMVVTILVQISSSSYFMNPRFFRNPDMTTLLAFLFHLPLCGWMCGSVATVAYCEWIQFNGISVLSFLCVCERVYVQRQTVRNIVTQDIPVTNRSIFWIKMLV